jgi:GNAT superfamily N-acetyltransferase
MSLREERPVALDYLDQVTRLLQDARLADPEGGLWEAADLQWWWRIDQHADPEGQWFWVDDGVPRAAVVFTRWKAALGCDLLGAGATVAEHADRLWDIVRRQFLDREVEMLIRDDDAAQIAAATAAAFVARDDQFVTAWMGVDERRRREPLPPGIRIEPYAGGRHPMVARSGDGVGKRLAECSLYRGDLDLAILAGDTLAGYALFWADPVTGVGLLELMRIEDAWQGRGLSKMLIAEGLERLAAAGCTRLKVSFDPKNEAAARLYLGAGYQPRSTARAWIRPGPRDGDV